MFALVQKKGKVLEAETAGIAENLPKAFLRCDQVKEGVHIPVKAMVDFVADRAGMHRFIDFIGNPVQGGGGSLFGKHFFLRLGNFFVQNGGEGFQMRFEHQGERQRFGFAFDIGNMFFTESLPVSEGAEIRLHHGGTYRVFDRFCLQLLIQIAKRTECLFFKNFRDGNGVYFFLHWFLPFLFTSIIRKGYNEKGFFKFLRAGEKMVVKKTEGGILLQKFEDFDLRHTFDCGQCFRFHEEADGVFCGVAFGRMAVLSQKGDSVLIENVDLEAFEKDWSRFLDCGRDYAKIKRTLGCEPVMREAISHGYGIRILRQDFFECLLSFILSQQNNIPKIKKAVEAFSERFGTRREYRGRSYYTFPAAEQVKNLKAQDLAFLKIGYRDKYIVDAIRKVNSGLVCREELLSLPYEQAKKSLMQINGVGQKVADCVLLFSCGRFDAFPVDTWMKKAMLSLYGVKEKEIPAYSGKKFGAYSGFAQQYLFYYARETKAAAI